MAEKDVYFGTGRRKSAVSRVRVKPGSGTITVNRKDYKEFFPCRQHQVVVEAVFKTTETEGKYDVVARTNGGGITGQSGAVLLGIARALCKANPSLEDRLRDAGHLTRDSRMVERKKYGQAGARRSFQFSKR